MAHTVFNSICMKVNTINLNEIQTHLVNFSFWAVTISPSKSYFLLILVWSKSFFGLLSQFSIFTKYIFSMNRRELSVIWYSWVPWKFWVIQHYILSPKWPNQGWSNSDSLTSNRFYKLCLLYDVGKFDHYIVPYFYVLVRLPPANAVWVLLDWYLYMIFLCSTNNLSNTLKPIVLWDNRLLGGGHSFSRNILLI